ncbi:MAG: hypothetical protein WC194_10075 [Mesotoga sp.]|uniref:hypothetical protein n=1 Tax=Mesotoga sp. TaxID=2053577 RepID=UPI000EF282AB|nr:hypothetical protein [Mesotoga sp.]MDD4208238.1 hypothetical protein [Mesotoga sp.]MDD4826520.1 hypothetical protein [Mesotoga sp.]NLT45556.1 hypothetical protein [Thermotogaceae bacterium]RLL86729.1 hypothetical protein Y697_10940 [Mesotoga sp. BH458_6_3_2_1]
MEFIPLSHRSSVFVSFKEYILLLRWKWGDSVKNTNYLLIGKGRNSGEVLKSFENCPYVVSCSCSKEFLWVNFKLPVDHKWWLEGAEEDPVNTLGLESVEVFELSRISGESAFSEGKTEGLLSIAPCGSDCLQCPLYSSRCGGCPETVYFGRNETK